MMPWRRYRGLSASAWGLGFVVAGVAAMALAWRGAAATLFVPTQVAFAVSGWIGGLLLVAVGLSVLRTQARRVVEAEHAHRMERVLDLLDEVNRARR